jgi:hypothetical protein
VARRITTPVSEAPFGFVHDKAIEYVLGVALTLVTAPAPARTALIPGLVWATVTLTGVALAAVGWSFQHWSTYPVASEDPPVAPKDWKQTW